VSQGIRDAYEGKAPDHESDSFSGLPCTLSEPPSVSGLPYNPNFWNLAIGKTTTYCFTVQHAHTSALGIDNYLSTYGIELDTEHQIEDETATCCSLELMNRNPVEALDAVNITEPPSFPTSTRPGTRLPPPLNMPQRPSTISKMKDDVNFDISEWFDNGGASASSPSVPHSASPALPDGDPSADDVLPSDTIPAKFDLAVSFEEYLRLSKSQETARARKSNSHPEKRGNQALPYNCAGTGSRSAGPQELETRGADCADGFKHAFEAGGQDVYLPAFSDPAYDEEFAAFAAAGRNVNQHFRDIRQEFKSRKVAATAAPSPSRVAGLQAPEISPDSEKGDDFMRAGQIYVAHILHQNPELADTPKEASHSHTEDEIEWAQNYLPDDVKVWLKRNCGMVGADEPTPKRLDKALEKVNPKPELVFSHTAVPSSQKPEGQSPNGTAHNQKYCAEHDKLMSLLELDMEWDAFEVTHPPTQTVPDDLQTLPALPDAILALPVASPASTKSFHTATDDEMSMIPTIATPDRFIDAPNKSPPDTSNKTSSPKAGASAYSDPSLASIATRLSEAFLDKTEEHATGSIPRGVETNSIAESAGGGSQTGRMTEDKANSKEMDRLIEQYDYGLYGHGSRASGDGFRIGEDDPALVHVQECASKLGNPAHPKKSDAQPNRENAKLPVNPQISPDDHEELPAGHSSPMCISDDEQEAVESHNSPMSISDDKHEVAEVHNSPMNISGHGQAFSEDQDTPKVSTSGSRATGENQSQTHHGATYIIETQRGESEPPQSVTESTSPMQLVHSRTRPDLETEQLTSKYILQTPKGTTFISEVSAPSPILPTSSLLDSAAVSGTPIFTCIKCNQAYKKKAYLLKHEAKGNCKPKTPKPPRVPVFAGIPTMKLSMTDQELVDNGLPSVQARNWRNFSSCTACNMEFSNVGRLRLHILQSCPILRENGVYNQPQNQQLAVDDQALARQLPKSNTAGNVELKQFSIYCSSGIANLVGTGYLLMDGEDSEIDNSRPFSISDLGILKDSLHLSDKPINVVGADNKIVPNTINGPRPNSSINRALFAVSMSTPGQIKFPTDNDGTEKTPDIRRPPGQVIQLTSQQLKHFNLPLPGGTDLSIMEETNIGEKVYKADSMAEIPALRQSSDPSPLKSATPAIIRSTARSQNIEGSHLSRASASKLGRGTIAMKDSFDSPQTYPKQNDNSSDPELPRMRDDNTDDVECPGYRYPTRMRLFSEELALSSPHKSDPLEPFEDLPQKSMVTSAKRPCRVSHSVIRSTPRSASATEDVLENLSSVFFSFADQRLCAIAMQRLEELVQGTVDHTLQSLRIWPSFSTGSSPSNSTFEFKVSAPKKVNLVTTFSEIFPGMETRMRGDHVIFVGEVIAASNTGSTAAMTPRAIEAPVPVAAKAKKSKKVEKQAVEQPRRSSRGSSPAPESTSQINVKKNSDDGSLDPKEVKRRRSSSKRKSTF
jgi:hypothetical protein